MALRTIIPPLGNQWIFIMKATTIGVAIGFSDLVMLVPLRSPNQARPWS
jgi:ABC-type amino acid transport system permease subunit